jgi:predicted DNA-binding protein with PD1-like motif
MDFRNDGFLHLVRLDPGDKIIESLVNYVADRQYEIPSGFLTGIGAVSEAEIGWYDRGGEVYRTEVIKENLEITTLAGNIAWVEGSPMVHAHITLGRQDYSVLGGHLIEATISITGEIWIHTSQFRVARSQSEFKGLKLIDFKSK